MFSYFTPSVSLAIGPSTIPDPTPIIDLFLFFCIFLIYFTIGVPILALLRSTRKTCGILFSFCVTTLFDLSASILTIFNLWTRVSLRLSYRVLSATDLCSDLSSILGFPLLFNLHSVLTALVVECEWISRTCAWIRETVAHVYVDETRTAISSLQAKLRSLEAEVRAARSEAAEAAETLQSLVPEVDIMVKMFEDYRTTIENKKQENMALQRRLNELQAALEEGEEGSFG